MRSHSLVMLAGLAGLACAGCGGSPFPAPQGSPALSAQNDLPHDPTNVGFTVNLPLGWTEVPPTARVNGLTTVYQAVSADSSLFVATSLGTFASLSQASSWLETQDAAFAQETQPQPFVIGGAPGVGVGHADTGIDEQVIAQLDIMVPRQGRTYWIIFDSPAPAQPQLPALEAMLTSWQWS